MAEGNGKVGVPAEVAQSPRVMAMRIQALEDSLEKLTKVYSENMQHIRKAFAHTDGHMWVLKQLCVDIAMGEEIPMTEAKEGEGKIVDLTPYYKKYNENMEAQVRAEIEAAKASKEPPEEEDPEEFGGDVEDEQGQDDENTEAVQG